MNEFDDKLMERMERVDAPEGFVERVMMAAALETSAAKPTLVEMPVRPASKVVASKVVMMRPKAWWGGAIAAVLVLGVLGGEQVHRERAAQREMEAKRVQAEREFDTASRITDRTMERMREKLAKAGVQVGE